MLPGVLASTLVGAAVRLRADGGAGWEAAARRADVALGRARPAGFPDGPKDDCAPRMASDPLALLDELAEEYGDGGVAGLALAGQLVVIAWDAEAVNATFHSPAFQKDGTAFFPNSILTGDGLLTSDGEAWQRQRRAAAPAFRTAAVRRYSAVMAATASQTFHREWAAGNLVSLWKACNALTLNIAGEVLFGDDFFVDDAAQLTANLEAALDEFAARGARGFADPEWLPTPGNLRFRQAVDAVDDVVLGIIRSRRSGARGGNADDLLSRLIESSADASDRQLRDEVTTMLVAGQETSAIALFWLIVHLTLGSAAGGAAAEPLARCVAEVDALAASKGGERFTLDDVASLRHLEACVLESLRVHPPAYLVGRCANADTTLPGGADVPRGATVLPCAYLAHRSGLWSAPLSYEPRRWLRGGAPDVPCVLPEEPADDTPIFTSALRAGAEGGLRGGALYIPFGGGPRNCIGSAFAVCEVVVLAAELLRSYAISWPGYRSDAPVDGASGRLSVDARFPVRASAGLTLRPSSDRVGLALLRVVRR